jgi:antitoxin ParD1/3/4
MPVTLDPQQEALIRQKVESGLYQDADEVIGAALRLLDEHDRRRWHQQALAEGELGEAIELTPERMDQIMQRALDNMRSGKPIRDAVKP